MDMPETSGTSYTELNEPHERDNGTTTASRPDPKSVASDSARISELRARKRTKTGCLSKTLQMVRLVFQTTDNYQHVASDGSSAERKGLLARTAPNPKENVKGISLDSSSRILSMPFVLISQE